MTDRVQFGMGCNAPAPPARLPNVNCGYNSFIRGLMESGQYGDSLELSCRNSASHHPKGFFGKLWDNTLMRAVILGLGALMGWKALSGASINTFILQGVKRINKRNLQRLIKRFFGTTKR